jgi:hypothetical protein
VVQGRERLGFPIEASQAVRVCRHRLRQHLDGDLPLEVEYQWPDTPRPFRPRRSARKSRRDRAGCLETARLGRWSSASARAAA